MGMNDKIKGFNGLPEDADELAMGWDDEMDFVSKNEDSTEAFSASTDTTNRNNKVVNIHATAQLQVVLVKPERFDDACTVADQLYAKRPVVLHLESAY